VYKGSRFEKKSIEEVKSDIDKAAEYYGLNSRYIESAFLQDANALLMKTEDLKEVIDYIKIKFKNISRITSYARAQTLAKKKVSELTELKQAGLSRLHVGMETGYGPLLEYIRKGTDPEQIIEAGRKVVSSGISLCLYYMPGLGGRKMSSEHAIESAKAINAIDPDYIRLRSFRIIPGTPIEEKEKSGYYIPLNDFETVKEIRLFISNLNNITSTIVSDHMLNLLQEVEGVMPADKTSMIEVIDTFLALSDEEKEMFQVGVRLGRIRAISEFMNPHMRAILKELVKNIKNEIESRKQDIGIDGYLKEVLKGYL